MNPMLAIVSTAPASVQSTAVAGRSYVVISCEAKTFLLLIKRSIMRNGIAKIFNFQSRKDI